MRWLWSLLILLFLVPTWTGEPRLPLYRPVMTVTASRYVPEGGWPRRVGLLAPVGGVTLTSRDPAFGGFSALALWRGRAVLLSDGGNVIALRIAGTHLQRIAATALRDGPMTGWERDMRDSESLVIDRATGRAWVGFERANALWRYAPGFVAAEAWRAPPEMRDWGTNNGPEAMVRLNDGRFLVFREGWLKQRGPRDALLFDGDPASSATALTKLSYEPPSGYSPSDAAVLPNGDVLVLNRHWTFPLAFANLLVRIRRDEIRAGAALRGQVVADLGGTLSHENGEGLAVAQEHGRTMIWIVTDNDGFDWRPTILAKFRWLG